MGEAWNDYQFMANNSSLGMGYLPFIGETMTTV